MTPIKLGIYFVVVFAVGLLSGIYNPLIVEEIRGYCTHDTAGEFTKDFHQLDDEGMSQAIGYWKHKGWDVEEDWWKMTITVSCRR